MIRFVQRTSHLTVRALVESQRSDVQDVSASNDIRAVDRLQQRGAKDRGENELVDF